MGWTDYHLHTRDSADSTELMDRVCRRAIELRLDEVCFTEHYDTDPYDIGYAYYDDARYERRLAEVCERYGDHLVIRKGLEFDFQSRYAGRVAEHLAEWRFDYLLGSVHCIFGVMAARAVTERHFPPDEVYRVYFDEIRDLIATGLPNCLGHLDYVRKTLWRELQGYRYPDYERQMRDIVARLVQAEIGLEVNTRYFGPGGQPMVPGLDVLTMYREAGGRIVTLGSDAHQAECVAAGFPDACDLLRRAGFTEMMTFKDRNPVSRPLPTGVEGVAGGALGF